MVSFQIADFKRRRVLILPLQYWCPTDQKKPNLFELSARRLVEAKLTGSLVVKRRRLGRAVELPRVPLDKRTFVYMPADVDGPVNRGEHRGCAAVQALSD